MEFKKLVIAIDGPAASGKGTLGKSLADKLKLKYLDTGKLYRLIAFQLIEKGLSTEKKDIDSILQELEKGVSTDLINENLSSHKIGQMASIIAEMPEVRDHLLSVQRNFIKHSNFKVVLDGRDIGTVIYPEANLKFYITADIEVRAKRRYNQLSSQGYQISYEEVLQSLYKRDQRDSTRKLAPLNVAKDAILIDSSDILESEVLDKVLSIVYEKVSV